MHFHAHRAGKDQQERAQGCLRSSATPDGCSDPWDSIKPFRMLGAGTPQRNTRLLWFQAGEQGGSETGARGRLLTRNLAGEPVPRAPTWSQLAPHPNAERARRPLAVSGRGERPGPGPSPPADTFSPGLLPSPHAWRGPEKPSPSLGPGPAPAAGARPRGGR